MPDRDTQEGKRRPKALDPARVRWRWLAPDSAALLPYGGAAVLLLWYDHPRAQAGVPPAYWISPYRVGGAVVGWRVEPLTGHAFASREGAYDLNGLLTSCECKDFLCRRRRCKHLVGLAAALAAAGALPDSDPRP